jgi:hypothetical protein
MDKPTIDNINQIDIDNEEFDDASKKYISCVLKFFFEQDTRIKATIDKEGDYNIPD